MYGDFSNVEEEITGFPPASILDDVQITKCEMFQGTSKSDNTYEAIKFHFRRVKGKATQLFTATILGVNEAVIRQWDGNAQENIETAYKNLNTQLLHIVSKVGITKEDIAAKCTAQSFFEFGTKFAALTTEALSNLPETENRFYLKTMKNKGGYADLPKYPKFIEPMSIGDTTLAFSKGELKVLRKLNASAPSSSGDILEVNNGDSNLGNQPDLDALSLG